MKIAINLLGLFLSLIFLSNNISGQIVYKLDKKTESIHIATGLALNGVGLTLQYFTPDITQKTQLSLNQSSINRFDRLTVGQRSISADKLSDLLAYGSVILPAITYVVNVRDANWRNSSVMYLETVLYNLALTNIVKYSVRRKRPYVYSEVLGDAEVFDYRGSAAFYSGHTSFAASNAWFGALIFHDAFPESKWVPVMYGAAIVLPASTGFARVLAGEHFPTDVAVGYLMGAATAFAVVASHKYDRFEIETFGTSVRISYLLE